MDAGNYRQACTFFAKSHRLDPAMGTQFQLAQCYEKSGKLASAWENYVEVAKLARMAGMKDRESYSTKRAMALEPRLSRLKIIVSPQVDKIAGLLIRLDGKTVEKIRYGEPLPVDQGAHVVSAQAPNMRAWSTDVAVSREGTIVDVTIPALAMADGSGTGVAVTPTTQAVAPGQDEAESSSSGRTQRIAGVVVGSTGFAAMVVGVIVGVMAKSKYDSAEYCEANLCDEQGFDTRESARTQGTAATVVFAIGAAALVGGGVLWFAAPSGADDDAGSEQARLRLGVAPSNGGLSAVIRGSW